MIDVLRAAVERVALLSRDVQRILAAMLLVYVRNEINCRLSARSEQMPLRSRAFVSSVPRRARIMAKSWNCLRLAMAASFALSIGLSTPLARATDDALKQGYTIAAEKCSPCHAISHNDEPPHAIVIPFRQLHLRYPIPMLIEARDRGAIAGHDEMPMFILSQPDMTALLSYIDSLAADTPPYIPKVKRQ